ncbi:MAG TPA: carotenoid biosynthesis protein [Salinivirgaceae bacterium]|nr:carotenoid biosynthesis protein [Salinivirgaceae bacterium]
MQRKRQLWKILIVSGYLIGATGLIITYPAPNYYFLSWLFALITFIILIAAHTPWTHKSAASLALIGIAGWTIEAIGVNTGLIFGHYQYGNSLGFKIAETPLMMAINWIFMIYLVSMVLKDRITNTFHFLTIGGLTMVFYDLLLEPFAIRFDLWNWQDKNPPLQNFIGWFLVSIPMLYVCKKTLQQSKNELADTILLTQIFFYGLVNATVALFMV